jgi:2,3-dihydroxy-p-cumate/2,3-dihydroxybenzoate 3,4-dioxygenase
VIRYRKIGYVELNVTDLARSRQFYEGMLGLQFVTEGASGELLYRCSDDHHSVVLHQAAKPALKRVGFMLEDESQFASLERTLAEHRTPFEQITAAESKRRFIGRAIRMVEPNTQATLEFYVPADDSTYEFKPTLARIQRIGHVVFLTPNADKAVDYFRDVLNFRRSDSIGDDAVFMRPFPSPYHHGIGLFKSDRYGLHHVNFMVTEIDDIGRGFNRLRANDVTIANGIGRHPVSGSVFLYFFEPDGMTLEYSFGMEEFAEADPRQPKRWPYVPESFDIWGAPRHPKKSSVGDIEREEPSSSAA